jgi:DNA-binding CsgD family transcriptional regulator
LTSREVEVLKLIGRGLTNLEIADHLYISEATVKTHLNRTMSKLDLESGKALADPALSVRMRMSVPCRWASGICARAWSSTVMWSVAVLAPAFPGRSRPDSASPVLARKHSSGWMPKPGGTGGEDGLRESGIQLPCGERTHR